jgi:hypothetical protein
MLRPKQKLKSEKSYGNCKRAEKPTCHEIDPNPSKDRAMHEGDNPSF